MEIVFEKPSGFKSLPPNEQLDKVLNQLTVLNVEYHTVFGLSNLLDVNQAQILLILKKLEKDGYVTKDPELSDGVTKTQLNDGNPKSIKVNEFTDVYYLTFDGQCLLTLDKGYSGLFDKENSIQKNLDSQKSEALRQNTLQKQIQTRLNRLTFWIAVGTIIAAIYYLNELYLKGWFHWF